MSGNYTNVPLNSNQIHIFIIRVLLVTNILNAKGAIVATIGPSSDKNNTIEKMIEEGLDIIRLNMSHGTHEDHKKRFEMVRNLNDEIPILFDLSGPKIRIGKLSSSVILKKGDSFILSKDEQSGEENKVSVSYPELIDITKVDQTLFLNDGLLEFKVIEKTDRDLICEVLTPGPLSSRKGVNTPNIPIQLYAPTKKDKKDIEFTIGLEPDFYSISFVRRAQDIIDVKNKIDQYTTEKVPMISKIEHLDALDNIEEISKHSSGLMVARGDLGVELPPWRVPPVQKMLVNTCRTHGISCIIATQMLESMVLSSRPTRAEVSDVYQAIVQGADAVMLSAETATGNYPIETVKIMNNIIRAAQEHVKQTSRQRFNEISSISEAIGRAAVSLASGTDVDAIITFTRSGRSSMMISKFKPSQPILAISPVKKTTRRVRLQWGVTPLYLEKDFNDTDTFLSYSV